MKKRSRIKRSEPYYYSTPKTIESLNQNTEVIKRGYSKPNKDNFSHIVPNGRFGSNTCNCFSGTCEHDKEK